MTRLLTVMVALIVVPVGAAQGATYEVGPGKPYATLEDVDDLLGPGDVVLVSGGADYPGGARLERDGSASAPITIRGVGSPRPVISGETNTIELAGDHTVLERFDLTGGSFRCLYQASVRLRVRAR
jgi:hypothetical protein